MLRPDLLELAKLVKPGSRVLDLGCGDGQLLHFLANERDCSGQGVEIDGDCVLSAIERGVPVISADIESQLELFDADSYDYVIVSRTLQAVHNPEEVLRQIRRIGKTAVVSMPNFGHWRNRVALFFGRMPMSPDLPFAWYETPNIHYTTLIELERLFRTTGWKPKRRVWLAEGTVVHPWLNRLPDGSMRLPNLMASSGLYVLERGS